MLGLLVQAQSTGPAQLVAKTHLHRNFSAAKHIVCDHRVRIRQTILNVWVGPCCNNVMISCKPSHIALEILAITIQESCGTTCLGFLQMDAERWEENDSS
jgi:hypothetical protein